MTHETDSRRPRACAITRARLPLFVGGDLEGEPLADVRAHLETCEVCAQMAEGALRARRVLLAAWQSPPAALRRPGLWPAVRARLVEEGILEEGAPVLPFPTTSSKPAPVSSRGTGSSLARLRSGPRRLRRIAGLMAAAAAIIFLVVLADPFGFRADGASDHLGGDPGPLAFQDGPAEPPVEAIRHLRRISAAEEATLDALRADDSAPVGRPNASLAGESRPLGYR